MALFVFLKVSDGKTWDHLKEERKLSTKTERLKVWKEEPRRTEVSDRKEVKTGKTGPFLGCAYSGCSANPWDKDTIRGGSGPVPEKPGPSL